MKGQPNTINQLLKEANYKFLGWQNGWHHIYLDKDKKPTTDPKEQVYFDYIKEEYPEYRQCIDSGHSRDEISHNNRGSENTISCDVCKIYWKYDCSD